jgi:hypothetical protein
VPFPPDGIGLYSKNSAVNHLHRSQVESGPIDPLTYFWFTRKQRNP